ncbi:uncharacterized protein LOC130532298 isoform X1 [Takifugu flavidus]|uniref:uncharacterized protein LOC130532298 isoform X1 n=1 Tax=Takifugu flavidus TaxID=433684 RepID=UPI002544424C|nr:uncharacterized protein LOC130532298 isoform X1 [Takifugu flavidus]
MDCGWMQRMFLYLLIPGVSTLITVHQPPFVITVLGNDVIMPCHISSDDTLSPPVLYWEYPDRTKLWPPSEKFKQRVDRVDENKQSLNKSIILKNVQWVDSGNYLCKLSVLTAETKTPYRTKGNETRLIIHDTVIFDVVTHNRSLLSCQVNVSADPGFVLSILYNGHKICSGKPECWERGCNLAPQLHVLLSVTISLTHGGKYECQLHFNKTLLTKMVSDYIMHEQDVEIFPEPWLYYGGFLTTHCVTLSVITAALLTCRRGVHQPDQEYPGI